MNWFEDDNGFWHNLDLLQDIQPPGVGSQSETEAILNFANGERTYLTGQEWQRLKLQLVNSQRPVDRRPLSDANERTSPPDEDR